MRWGRRWGQVKNREGNQKFIARWGGEGGDVSNGRLKVQIMRGKIIPCDHCRRVGVCAMYVSYTRQTLRNAERTQGTNILGNCDIYQPMNQPGDGRAPMIHGRTSGKQPT